MKKIFLFLFICMVFIAGIFSFVLYKVWFSNNISISVNDSEDRFQLYASYPRNKARRIQHLIDSRFHNAMLRKNRVDGYMTTDDNTQFYVRTTPGRFLIRLNKNENNEEACLRLKQLGEEIKIELTKN